jgi:glycine cleavage system H protein
MNIEEGLKYSREHEWVRVEGDNAYIGITDFAQHNLGEIVYIELPGVGMGLGAGDVLCTVDSVKAASDVFAPVSGIVVRVNRNLSETPEKINSEPYKSWIASLKMDDAAEADLLMDADEYEEFCKPEE